MADTTFQSQITVVTAPWCQDVNNFVYRTQLNIAGLRLQVKTGPAWQFVQGVGLYYLVASDTTSPDNGFTIIVAADGGRWYLIPPIMVSVLNFGAKGDGVTNDGPAFATAVPMLLVPPSATGTPYEITTNTTVIADLFFTGGQISIASGVTLTINGTINAPSQVLFKGAGTVICNRGGVTGEIDVAWFDGTDASSKFAFAARGINNTNGTGMVVAFNPPGPNDAWATLSPNNQWGYGWRVDAPIDIEQAQAYTMYMTRAGFVATTALDAVFLVGNGSVKGDGSNFPLRLKVDGGNGLAGWAMRIRGASHMHISYMEAYYCGGIAFTPNGIKQCSDIQVDFLDTGALYNQAILFDGTTGVNNTITDIEIGFVNSTGFAPGHAADSVVKIGSNCNAINVRKVSHRAVVGGFIDATQAVVLITNGGTLGANVVSCRYGINIGPVINGSTTLTAECVVISDASGSTAAKMTGITIEAGSQVDGTPPGSATISLNYTNGAIVQGMPMASSTNSDQFVRVNSTCTDTRVYGVKYTQVSDGGVNTLIDGHNYGAIVPVAAPASGVGYTNNTHFNILYQVQGGTITGAAYTSGSTTLSLPITATAGAWMLRPGDNIAVSYSGSPSFNYVPM